MLATLAALGAALLYAGATVAQQREAARQPAARALRVALVVSLAQRPLWLAGNAADFAGYGLHFVALRTGSLVLVQPLLVTGLLFALPLGAWWERRPITSRQMTGAVGVVAGLSLFLIVSQPESPRAHASAAAWVLVFVVVAGGVGAILRAARQATPRTKAVLYGTAAGVLFAVTAALTEATGQAMRHGVLSVVGAWPLYALVAVGLVNIVVAQTAFQAGPLSWSLPALTVIDPLVSVLIGAFAFRESSGTGAGALVLEAFAIALMMLGVALVTLEAAP